MKLRSLTSILSLSSFLITIFLVSNASAINIGDLGKPKVGACESSELPTSVDLKLLKQKAEDLKFDRKYCESAQYFLKLMIETNSGVEYSWAWAERIEALFYQYDYDSVWLEAEQFLTQRRGSDYEWKVHFILVKAVHELAVEKPIMANIWFQYSLGIAAEQLNKESFKNNYSLRSFLVKYPNREEVKFVLPWLQEFQQNYSQDYLKQARFDRMRRDYVPAIVKYKFLLQQGPSFKEFSIVVFEAIQTISEFAFFVDNEKIVSTKKLSIWMMQTEDQINSQLRLTLKTQLETQARELYFMMLEKLPSDPWTEKAKHEFAFSK